MTRTSSLRAGVAAALAATAFTALAAVLAVLAAPAAVAASPTAEPSAAPAPIAVSVSDNVTSAQAGQRLTYQAAVTNNGATDLQLLLEITVPSGAKVVDAGGGTIRDSLIDYGVTVLAHARVAEKFVVTLGPIGSDQQRVDTLAAAYLLGRPAASGAAGSSAADVTATDSDAVVGAAAASGHGANGNSAAPLATAGAAGRTHTGWWISALVLGALLIVIGLALALRRGGRATPIGPPEISRPIPVVRLTGGDLSHPGRGARRAAEAAADAGVRTGAHQANRPVH